MSLADLVPVSELVVRRVIALLQGITLANGYANEALVERAEEDGNPKGGEGFSLHIVVDETPPADAPDVTPIRLDGYRLDVIITYLPMAGTPNDDVPIQFAFARAHADIRKALDANRQLNGLAVNTTFGAPTYGEELGSGLTTATLVLGVLFWTKRYDPYSLPGA